MNPVTLHGKSMEDYAIISLLMLTYPFTLDQYCQQFKGNAED